MENLFSTGKAKRRQLPDTIRGFIVDLKAEYPPFSMGEIANIVHACYGREPDPRSVQRVLNEEPTPLKILGLYPSYYEMEDSGGRRAAIVELRLHGWSARTIAGYLGIHVSTVYRTRERWKE